MIQWIRCFWNMLVSYCIQLTSGWNKGRGGGVNMRRKTKTKYVQKEWRNVGRKIQLNGGYRVFLDVGRLVQSWYGWATGTHKGLEIGASSVSRMSIHSR